MKPALKRSVLLNVLTVLVKGGGSNALNLTTGQGRLKHVTGVEGSSRTASADDGVDFIDEQNDVVVFLEFIHQGLHALLELTAVFGSRDKTCEVKSDYSFAK